MNTEVLPNKAFYVSVNYIIVYIHTYIFMCILYLSLNLSIYLIENSRDSIYIFNENKKTKKENALPRFERNGRMQF